MNETIITISRGFGSNGVAIGKRVAAMLGVAYYDDAALREIGGERLKSAMNDMEGLPPEDAALAAEDVFRIQADIIHKLAEKESFVIMGRAADYVLRDMPNVIRVNIHSGFEDCVRTIAQREGLSEAAAGEKIRRIDSGRAEFYQKHTGRVWNDPLSFDLTLNSSSIGSQSCAELIVRYVEIWKKHNVMC
ncbi:MAG: AAA family ATPase [Candidatus Heteroscillospira sp.]|jgi:cytidylate kinase